MEAMLRLQSAAVVASEATGGHKSIGRLGLSVPSHHDFSDLTFLLNANNRSWVAAAHRSPLRCDRGRGTGGSSGGVKRAVVVAALNGGGGNDAIPFFGRSSDAVTYSANISTDLPLYEPAWVSFDDYLEDRPRVFRAMFPDKRRSRRINDEEWKIRMLPIQFLLVSAYPIIIMRLRNKPRDAGCQPTEVANSNARLLELQITGWELQGLDSFQKPSRFDLNVMGTLYSDRIRGRSRLKGHLEMSITMVLPQAFAFVPREIVRGVAESVLKRLMERMKKEVDTSLLADFKIFSREMRNKQVKQNQLSTSSSHPNTELSSN